MRQSLDEWFHGNGIRPRIVGEFDDSALIKSYGQIGMGMFAAPALIRTEVMRQYSVKPIGAIDGQKEKFYIITVDRLLRHPAVIALTEFARKELVRP